VPLGQAKDTVSALIVGPTSPRDHHHHSARTGRRRAHVHRPRPLRRAARNPAPTGPSPARTASGRVPRRAQRRPTCPPVNASLRPRGSPTH